MAPRKKKPRAGRLAMVVSVASAIGVAALTLGVNLVQDWMKERGQKAIKLQETFTLLEDDPRAAKQFIEEGRGGTPDQVRKVARHFQIVVDAYTSGAASQDELKAKYKGLLYDWTKLFRMAANPRLRASQYFDESERKDFIQLSASLNQITGGPQNQEELATMDEANRSQMESNVTE
jgi:hypothetical protein